MSEWKIIFFIAAAFFFLGNLIFVIFGKASIQPWNDPEEQQKLPQQQQVQIFSVEPDDERLGKNPLFCHLKSILREILKENCLEAPCLKI